VRFRGGRFGLTRALRGRALPGIIGVQFVFLAGPIPREAIASLPGSTEVRKVCRYKNRQPSENGEASVGDDRELPLSLVPNGVWECVDQAEDGEFVRENA